MQCADMEVLTSDPKEVPKVGTRGQFRPSGMLLGDIIAASARITLL